MATLYWYGGSGNWSDYTNHWSNNSGNSPASPAAAVPTSSDDVVFDSNSHSSSYTMTIDATADCGNITFGNPSSGSPTLAGTSGLSVYGNISLVSGMTNSYTGTITMKATSGTKTITSNGVKLHYLYIYGIGGTFQLADNLTIVTLSRGLGTFDNNGKDVTIDMTTTANGSIIGSNISFTNLTLTGFYLARNSKFSISENITITGTFTANGSSGAQRFFIKPYSSPDSAKTITANAVSISNIDFLNITGAGSATWSGTSIGDGGGNSNISFTSPVTRYWVGTSGGNWNDTANWSDESGGEGGLSVPLFQDTAVFDSNSITSASRTITMNCDNVPAIDFSNIENSPSISIPAGYFTYVYGGMNLSGITSITTSDFSFIGKSSYNIYTNGKSLGTVYFVGIDSSYTLADNLSAQSGIYMYRGTIDFNDKDVSTKIISSNVTVDRTIRLGNGTITIGSSSAAITALSFASTGLTFYPEGSTIKISSTGTYKQTFTGGGLTYNNLQITGSGDYTTAITGSNTFNEITIDTAPKTVTFYRSTTNTVEEFNARGTASNKITLDSDDSSTQFILSKPYGLVRCDYLDVSNSSATGGASWYAGVNSTDTENNDGWIFGRFSPLP